MLELTKADGLLMQGMLSDGTNIMGLLWPTGQRLLRTGPQTGWSVQEHFMGHLPEDREARKTVSDVWLIAVESMIEAGHDSDQDMIRMGLPPVRKARRG